MANFPPYQTPIVGTQKVTRDWHLYFLSLMGSSGAASTTATYVLASADATLPNSRVASDSTSVTVNIATAGQISWERAALTGDITASANANATTLSNTGVTATTYGDATHVGQFTVDAKGRLTAAANVAITGTGISLLKATKTLNNADIIALGTPTQYVLATALGANTVLQPVFIIFKAYLTVGYGNIADGSYFNISWANGDLAAQYIAVDSTASPPLTALTDLLGQNFSTYLKLDTPWQQNYNTTAQWGVIPSPSTQGIADQNLVLDYVGGTGVLTGGNAGNSLVIDTYYISVDI